MAATRTPASLAEPLGKSYQQLCPLAIALDHVGDRWSMLIVRELLGGPARFSELKDALPGIASNLLTIRLRKLEASGVVERRHERGGATYALTPLGHGLRRPLELLGLWGAAAGPVPGSDPRPLRAARSMAMAFQAMLGRGEMPATRRRVGLRLDEDSLTIEFGGAGGVEVRAGVVEPPDALVSSTMIKLRVVPVPGPGPDTFEFESGDRAIAEEFLHALRISLGEIVR